MLAWVCGDVCIWKPSEKTPLTAVACQNLLSDVFRSFGAPEGLSCLVVGDYKVGEWISSDERIPLVSATGSTRMGKLVGEAVARRLGRSLLELGATTPSSSVSKPIWIWPLWGRFLELWARPDSVVRRPAV